MSKICYIEKRFSRINLKIITSANEVIDLYKKSGRRPTVSNIFKKLVETGLMSLGRKDYKRLVTVISNARTAGMIGWDDIDGRRQKHTGEVEI